MDGVIFFEMLQVVLRVYIEEQARAGLYREDAFRRANLRRPFVNGPHTLRNVFCELARQIYRPNTMYAMKSARVLSNGGGTGLTQLLDKRVWQYRRIDGGRDNSLGAEFARPAHRCMDTYKRSEATLKLILQDRAAEFHPFRNFLTVNSDRARVLPTNLLDQQIYQAHSAKTRERFVRSKSTRPTSCNDDTRNVGQALSGILIHKVSNAFLRIGNVEVL